MHRISNQQQRNHGKCDYSAAFKKPGHHSAVSCCRTTSDEAKAATGLKPMWSDLCSVLFTFPVVSLAPASWFTRMSLNKQLLNQDWHFSDVWSTAQRELWTWGGGLLEEMLHYMVLGRMSRWVLRAVLQHPPLCYLRLPNSLWKIQHFHYWLFSFSHSRL